MCVCRCARWRFLRLSLRFCLFEPVCVSVCLNGCLFVLLPKAVRVKFCHTQLLFLSFFHNSFCSHWWIQGRGRYASAFPLSVQFFFQFHPIFRKKAKMTDWHRHLWGWRPHLGNPGSTTGPVCLSLNSYVRWAQADAEKNPLTLCLSGAKRRT